MKKHDITVYTQPDCPPCSFVKELLSNNTIPYTEKDIRKDHHARKELIEKYKAMSTPVVIINEQIYYSSDLSRLPEALGLSKKN
ncbi:glutaredoxin family protein [Bacillus sp. SCS-153A]|uniref:glutaredoxin family protein n=1 Tax=Rossellomorea sedimentorum TaxID=3115294 RepID=UPI003905BA73